MAGDRRVVFVVFDGMKMLDVAGPAEVLADANLFGAGYTVSYVSASGKPVQTSVGIEMPVDGAAGEAPDPDTVIVAGGDQLVSRPIPADLIAAIQQLRPCARRLVSICTGSFALAAAGVLSGRNATTHWRHAQLLSRSYPDIRVQPNALFVEDEGVFTSAGVSAGVSAGIDLALALVEQDHGPDLARDVARNLVMFMQRPGASPSSPRPSRSGPLARPLSALLLT